MISEVAPTSYRGAVFSPDRLYRYVLWRRWRKEGEFVAFVGLNPSTATEWVDDPTVYRCIQFAKKWNYSGMYMLNLFAFRATDPRDMKAHPTPVGPRNDATIVRCCKDAATTVVCWGVHGTHLGRDEEVLKILPVVPCCLGLTKGGHPKHPLFLRGDSKMISYG